LLDVGWDERLWQGRPWPHPGSRFPGWNQVDSWVLAGPERPLGTLDARAGRYLLLASWSAAPLVLADLAVLAEGYPAAGRGRFASDRPLLDRIWQVGADTVALNMTDTYADPWRERGQWWGDAWVDAHIDRVAHGDPALYRRALGLMADGLAASGRASALVPGQGPELIDYSLLWVQGLAEHSRRTGDLALARAQLGRVRALLDRLAGLADPASGLLDLPERPGAPDSRLALIDWGGPADTGTYYSRYGQSTALNALYAGTLRQAAELAAALGDGSAASWRQRADRLQAALNGRLYDRAARRYLTTRLGARAIPAGPHAQAWPLAYGLVEPSEVSAVADSLLGLLPADPDRPAVDLYGSFWLLEGLAAAGRVTEALALIERHHGRLLERGATTWWESFYSAERPDQALSHAWGGSPTWFLTTHALGLRQTGPRSWQLRPALAGLSRAEGVLPLPGGDLAAGWRRTGCGRYELTVDGPAGTLGELVLPFRDGLGTLAVDGRAVQVPPGTEPRVDLAPGRHAATVGRPCHSVHLPRLELAAR
jgi:alpha-L-rhamnosidase